MLRFAAAVLTASFLSVTPAFSHGELTHVLGTVSRVDADHLTVNTKTGETVQITVTDQTNYRNQNAGSKDALKIGDRVVIEVQEKSGNLIADEIRFASPTKPLP